MSRGRPLGYDPDHALEDAMQLFWHQGFEATSLQDLLDAMAIGRSSFYQRFGSKQALFLAAVDRYRDQLVATLEASLTGADSGCAFIAATLHSVATDTRSADGRRGCLVFNAASEIGDSDREIAARVAVSIDAFSGVFCKAIEQAQREGDIEACRDPRLLARYAVVTMSGLRTLAKSGAATGELEALAAVAMKAFT